MSHSYTHSKKTRDKITLTKTIQFEKVDMERRKYFAPWLLEKLFLYFNSHAFITDDTGLSKLAVC